jgi:hypothetical protein
LEETPVPTGRLALEAVSPLTVVDEATELAGLTLAAGVVSPQGPPTEDEEGPDATGREAEEATEEAT